MAGLGRKVFSAGEILTAADLQGYAVDQSVMVFADSAARGSAIPSPSEGMVTYLEDSDKLFLYTTAWEEVTPASINDIGDVDTSGAAEGQVLKYDGSDWVDAPVATNTDGDAGGRIFVGATDPDGSYTLATGDVWIEVPS